MNTEQLKKIKVLFVDDDLKILKSASYNLEAFTLYTASCIQDAIKIFNTENIDVIVSDYNMNNGTGLDLKKAINQLQSRVPFIVISGEITTKLSLDFANIHVFHIFEKPIIFEEIEKKIVEAYITYNHEILKDKFASIGKNSGQILHDINNSLAVISLSSELGLQKSEDTLVQSQFERSIEACGKISKLIKKYKSFISNDTKIEMKPINVKNFLRAIYKDSIPVFKQDGIKIELDDKLETHSIMLADEDILYAVFQNLLKNSMDAIKGKDSPWIKISATLDDQKINIRITDSGNGIDHAIIENMFTEGFTTKGSNGTGMGLSYCNHIVNMHFGEIRYDKHASNTTFCVELPLNYY